MGNEDTYKIGYLDQRILMERNTFGFGYLWEMRILMRLDTWINGYLWEGILMDLDTYGKSGYL